MVQFKPLDKVHAKELSQVASQIFLDTFLPTNKAKPVHDYVEANFNPEVMALTLVDINYKTLGVFNESELIGYLQMVINAQEIYEGTSLELKRFYLLEKHQGKGIAKEMMEACYEMAKTLGYKKFWLGVWEHNHRAQAFYKKCGFRKVSSHVFDMGGEIQTDDILFKEF
jgi:diamine N-acetyltransferase